LATQGQYRLIYSSISTSFASGFGGCFPGARSLTGDSRLVSSVSGDMPRPVRD
jgi:hypothetical protein